MNPKVLFLSHNPHEVHLEWARSIGARIKITPFKRYNVLAKNFVVLRYLFPIVSFFHSFFVSCKEEVLFVDGGTSIYLASFLKMRNKKLKIIYLDADLFFYNWYSRRTITKKIQSLLFFKKIDAIISVSKEIARYSKIYTHVPIKIVAPYPQEIKNKSDRSTRRKDYGLYVGRIDPDKNIRRIIDFSLQCSHLEKFLIIGSGASENEIKKRIHKKNKVSFLGFKKDVEKYYNKCKFLIHLPDSDPHPCTTMEAALGGCFPIISKGCGSKYLFDEMFIINNPEDFKEINKKIKYILDNEKDARKSLRNSIKNFPTKEKAIKNFKEKFKLLLEKV